MVELEERHAIFDQPGKLRLGAFANSGNTANYSNVLAIEAANPALDINDVATLTQRNRPKYGFYVNLEQQLAKDFGVFARASWNDGQKSNPVVYQHRPQHLGRDFSQEQLLGPAQ